MTALLVAAFLRWLGRYCHFPGCRRHAMHEFTVTGPGVSRTAFSCGHHRLQVESALVDRLVIDRRQEAQRTAI